MRWLALCLILFSACSQPRVSRPQYRDVAIAEIERPQPPLPKPQPQKGLIIIDPGHGGDDDGTKSLFKPIYYEKYLNLSTARWLATYLKQMGYQIQMTRESDIFIPLKERATFANEKNPLLFVSVHYNSAPAADAEGVEVYYYNSKEDAGRTRASKTLAASVLKEVISSTQAKSRGVKAGNFAVIRETTMPAVLVEGGFLTNTDELNKIKDPAYMKKIAWGIAQGINSYLD